MKKLVTVLVIGTMIIACSKGKKVTTQDAKKVEVVTTNGKTKTYKTVKDGSTVNWFASHLGGAQPRYVKIFLKQGEFLVNNNKLTNATVLLAMNSLKVESFPEGSEQIAKLEGHLKSKDFFMVAKFPTSKFVLTKVEKGTVNGFNSKVTGNLTILDITKSITFNANISVLDNEVSLNSEKFTIDRTDWNLKYNIEGTIGMPKDYLIANGIGFKINVILVK